MKIDQVRIDELVAGPTEGLNVEIKRWIGPDTTDGIVKIIKAAIGLRNRNGGFLVIGFDDKTLLPDYTDIPDNVRLAFNLDKIQGIISKYAHEPFEITIAFGRREKLEFPVIVVPEGVRVPVTIRRDLMDDGRKLLREGDVYFRTLSSNGTPSTAIARSSDWRDIVEVCFENREADIGRFLRRHLGQQDFQQLLAASVPGVSVLKARPTLGARTEALLRDGDKRFRTAVATRKFSPEELKKINGGSWSVAVVADPPNPTALPDKNFLNTVSSSNPQYTGWPAWLDSRGFHDATSHPHIVDKAWQALIVSLEDWGAHVDFMRLDPKGELYLHRILQDDLTEKVPPGTALDVVLMILRVAEAIAVPLSLFKALGWVPEDTTLGFRFRWTKLSDRELSSWANPMVHVSGGKAHDDAVESFAEVPLDTPPSAIAPYVDQIVRQLFVLFDGYTIPKPAIEHWVQKLIERRL